MVSGQLFPTMKIFFRVPSSCGFHKFLSHFLSQVIPKNIPGVQFSMLNLIDTNGLICIHFLLLSGHSGPYHDRLEQLEAHLDKLRVTNPIASRHTRRKRGPYICRFFPPCFMPSFLAHGGWSCGDYLCQRVALWTFLRACEHLDTDKRRAKRFRNPIELPIPLFDLFSHADNFLLGLWVVLRLGSWPRRTRRSITSRLRQVSLPTHISWK